MKKFIASALSACLVSFTLISVNAQATGIINGDFTDGINGWTVTDISAVSIENEILHINSPCVIVQKVSVENGVYNLTADFTNTNPSQNAYLYAKSDGSTAARTVIPKYSSPTSVTACGVNVTDGSIEIGINAPEGGITVDNITLTPASEKQTEFLLGGEISKLTYVEDKGGIFRDQYGNERDALQIMAENGFNLARIRVLNNPGKGRGDGTYYLPEGYQNEADCLELARRAKDKGMKIQFSFAYSDYWADGAQQYIPAEWQEYITEHNITDKQALTDYLAGQVYDYTEKVMQDLIAQDTVPEYVSIGNEMQFGILFGNYKNNNGLYNTEKYQVQLLNAGARAVRKTSPTSKIILHTDNGGKVSARSVFYNTFLAQVDYDIIGVSYYPYYNKSISIDNVINEFNSMIKKYDKDVIIMETGYNWNEKRGDGWEGQLQDSGYYQNIYGETKEGQHAFLTELYAKLKTNVTDGRCIGDLYWDPVMLYDGGSYTIGWAIKEDGDWTDANVVSNSNLFDFTGKALPSHKAMKYNNDAKSDILVSGKTDKPQSELSLTVNGEQYAINTDKFGEYIVSVPYADKFVISLLGYDNSYELDAPKDDFMVRNADFPAPSFSFSYSPKSGVATLPRLEENASVFAAFYNENGILKKTERFDVDAHARTLTFSPVSPSENVKVFLWNSADGMKPLSDIAKTLDAAQ